jgi:hypothetical protein
VFDVVAGYTISIVSARRISDDAGFHERYDLDRKVRLAVSAAAPDQHTGMDVIACITEIGSRDALAKNGAGPRNGDKTPSLVSALDASDGSFVFLRHGEIHDEDQNRTEEDAAGNGGSKTKPPNALIL